MSAEAIVILVKIADGEVSRVDPKGMVQVRRRLAAAESVVTAFAQEIAVAHREASRCDAEQAEALRQ